LKKSKRNILRLTGGFLFILFLSWVSAHLLVSHYKEAIHAIAIKEINHRIKGNVTLGSLTPAFFTTFPHLAVCLTDLVIRDSLWNQHHHDLLHADKIYISFGWKSLLKGKPDVCKVAVQRGALYLYTDPCGISNLIETEHIKSTAPHHALPEFSLRNTRITMENEMLNARHEVFLNKLHCQINERDSFTTIYIDLRSIVQGIGFNLEKGSYLRGKTLGGSFTLTYYPEDRLLLKNINLAIADKPFNINGAIFLDADTMSYDLRIRTDQIYYADAHSLLTQAIVQKVSPITIDQPIDITASISGKMARKVIPHIETGFIVKRATMETPIGQLENATFSGTFNNRIDTCQMPGDANTKFTFNKLSADWNQITLQSDLLEITNLLNPVLSCDLKSDFALTNLNTLGESTTIQFVKGTGKLDVHYHGSIAKEDTISPVVNGLLSLHEASMHYLPRDLVFDDCSGEIEFTQHDVVLKDLKATVGHSAFTMNGYVQNLMAMLNLNPEQLVIDLAITSPSLDLGDFISYAKPSSTKTTVKTNPKNKITKATENTDRMLQNGKTKLTIKAGELYYKKFKATQVTASLLMEGNKVTMNEVRLQHAGGTASVKGTLVNGARTNFLKIDSRLTSMDIPRLFRSFDNFGQDAVTSVNTKGQLSAKIGIACELTDKAIVRENTMKGTVDFSLVNGELNQFEPAMKITEVAFKKRDFSHIRFAELRNQLQIDGSAFLIRKMEIRSNVVVLFIEGIYDTKRGTDMSIQVPVSNLSRAENDILENKDKTGVNIRLRAKTGEDGNLNISWDPLNNAGRQRKAEAKKDDLPKSGGRIP